MSPRNPIHPESSVSHSLEYCERHLEQLFAEKDKKFWKDGITKLPEKWQKVVEQKDE